jgi:hypothetical protein
MAIRVEFSFEVKLDRMNIEMVAMFAINVNG